jgi:hypothetical protein
MSSSRLRICGYFTDFRRGEYISAKGVCKLAQSAAASRSASTISIHSVDCQTECPTDAFLYFGSRSKHGDSAGVAFILRNSDEQMMSR